MALKEIIRPVVHILLDRLKDLPKLRLDLIHGYHDLLAVVTAYNYYLVLLDLLRPDLDTGRYSKDLLL